MQAAVQRFDGPGLPLQQPVKVAPYLIEVILSRAEILGKVVCLCHPATVLLFERANGAPGRTCVSCHIFHL